MPRHYNTDSRAEQTTLLRARILDATLALFLAKGYLATTVAQIADAARVSVQTVYNVVGGKGVLLKAVYDRALAGDDEPVAMADRPEIRDMLAASDARTALAAYARLGRAVSERVLPLTTMTLAQARTGDAVLAEFARTIERERGIGAAATVRHLDGRFGLGNGLDQAAAADILWTLTAPELAHRLIYDRGWTWNRFETWLIETITAALAPAPAESSPNGTTG